MLELAYAQKAPTVEAAYALHEQSALKLYDCLLPKIRQHAQSIGIYCETCKDKNRDAGIVQMAVSIDQLREMNKLHNSKVPFLEAENGDLKERI